MCAKTFPDDTFHPVAVDCVRYIPFRNHHAKAWMFVVSLHGNNLEETVGGAPAILKNARKFTRLAQPAMFPETRACRHSIVTGALMLQADRLARPLARRALIILRPLRVRMRARNP
jgi:hypothetical protein